MVSFNENPESYGDNRMLNQLDAQIKRTIELAHKLRTVDRDIASSPLYIQKVPSRPSSTTLFFSSVCHLKAYRPSVLSSSAHHVVTINHRPPAAIGVGDGTTSTWVTSTWAVRAA